MGAIGKPQALARVVLVVALAVFIYLILNSPINKTAFDERYFVRDIPILRQYGLTPKFLLSLGGAAGPLYAVTHAAFEPLTHLQPIPMRLVNLFLLLVLFCSLLLCFRRLGATDPWIAAGSVLIVPMTWVLGGIALSEMPALVFVGFSLYFQLRALEDIESQRRCLLWFTASAAFLGVAVWGRQPYLLLAGIPVLLALRDRRLWLSAAIFMGVVLLMTAPLFIVWQGLTPPLHAFMQKKPPSIGIGLITLSYVGICLLLLEPTLYWRHLKSFVALFVVFLPLNWIFSISTDQPLRQLAGRFLPSYWLPIYGHITGAMLMAFGAGTLLFLCQAAWRDRTDLWRLSLAAGVLILALWPALAGIEFSSRYVGMALPYILLLVEPWRKWSFATVTTAAIGCALGAATLPGYYLAVRP